MPNKKAQAWGFDAMVAIVVFVTTIAVFYLFTLNYQYKTDTTLEELRYDSNKIADSLLSEGYPEDWNENNVVRIGILTDNKINSTKIKQFNNLAKNSYSNTLSLFGIRNNYYVNLSEAISVEGEPEPLQIFGSVPSETKNAIKITRYSSYSNKPINIYVTSWN